MPYYVQKSGKTYRIGFQSGKSIPSRNISKKSKEAIEAGFKPEMTYEQAYQRAKQLQSESWVEADALRAASLKAKTEKGEKLRSAFLNDADAEEFEAKWLRQKKIPLPCWNMMQRILVDVALHPADWFQFNESLYEQFYKQRCSPNYAKKLLRFLNMWGLYLCKKHQRFWAKVPAVTGEWNNKMEAGRRSWGRPSLPLSPEMLASKRLGMEPQYWRWLFISVWFGLRPREVDNFKSVNRDLWYVKKDSEGQVLAVFQEKVYERGTPKEECWKYIPLEFPEQEEALRYIVAGDVERPVGATGKFMRNTFGQGYTHYAGRVNFTALLKDAGYSPETRQKWMGHLDARTTSAYDRRAQLGKVHREKRKIA